ncbi:MAG: LiaF transmembrane domain-containing protein [Ignavibacteria bacterium]
MTENRTSAGGRITLGLIIIFIGSLFLFHSLDYLDFNVARIFFSWPFIMFLVGLLIIVNSHNKLFGLILFAIGGVFLLPRIFPDIEINHGVIFPVLIILLGVYIISKHRITSRSTSGPFKESYFKKDTIDDIAVFGGGTKVFSSDNFKGGNITSIFGGSEIDLTGCKLAEGENIIDALFIFGGSEIYVPKDWNVISSMTPIFGGFSNKIRRDPNMAIDTSRTLVIKGLAIFGGGEVKSKF